MVHAKKSYNFTSKVIAIVFWEALCDAIRRDLPRFAAICLAIGLPFFFGRPCMSNMISM